MFVQTVLAGLQDLVPVFRPLVALALALWVELVRWFAI